MKSFTVGEFKVRFSEILKQVRAGEEILITYGEKQENVAVIISYDLYQSKKIKLGTLDDKELYIADDFKMSAEELLDL